MSSFGWAKVGVFCAETDPYSRAYPEVIEHAGLRVEYLDEMNGREISRLHILVLCGAGQLKLPQVQAISEWLKKGNTLICSGGTWNLENALGLTSGREHLSSGYLVPSKTDRLWPEGADCAKFFGAESRMPSSCEVVARIGETVGISRRKSNRSLAIYLAPHVGQTLQLMQYGRSVECDAIGPSDGSAILDNGILRAEDGTVLDFERDRCKVDGCDTPFFGNPHSDIVREILIRAIVMAADVRGLSIPLFWHWPHNAKSCAIITIDCEEFEREHVNQFHRMLSMFGAPAAWLVGLPGYSLDVYRAMRAWEHEIGLLFLTDDYAGWHEEKFKIQGTAVSRLSAQPNLMSSRPQDGRWRGYRSFYDLCEVGGARVSVSKGGRQPGTSGFLFGTCHPFVPSHRDGHHYLVTEIPYSVFHPGTVTPDPVAEKLAYQASSRYGCCHMVCPSDSMDKAESAISIRRILSVCKQQRMEFMLPEAVHRFERGRRQMRVTQKFLDGEGTLLVTSDTQLLGLTVLVNGQRLTAQLRGKELNVETVERYGCTFNVVQVNLEPKLQTELRLWPSNLAVAA